MHACICVILYATCLGAAISRCDGSAEEDTYTSATTAATASKKGTIHYIDMYIYIIYL
jgi:hypothetical protein